VRLCLSDVQFATVAKGHGCEGERVERVADFALHPMDMPWTQVVAAGAVLKPHTVERLP
jgi:hypothetical protein